MNHEKKFDPTKPVLLSASPEPESSALNATQHGCCATGNLILPTEKIENFRALETAWRQTYTPQTDTEAHLVDQLITADWLLQRSLRTLIDVESQLFAAEPNPLQWTDQHHKTITRFQRYRTANQNAVAKCRKAIEEHRKNRANEKLSERKQVMATERHAAYLLKNKPEPTWDETIDRMRRQAIALGFRLPDPPPPAV